MVSSGGMWCYTCCNRWTECLGFSHPSRHVGHVFPPLRWYFFGLDCEKCPPLALQVLQISLMAPLLPADGKIPQIWRDGLKPRIHVERMHTCLQISMYRVNIHMHMFQVVSWQTQEIPMFFSLNDIPWHPMSCINLPNFVSSEIALCHHMPSNLLILYYCMSVLQVSKKAKFWNTRDHLVPSLMGGKETLCNHNHIQLLLYSFYITIVPWLSQNDLRIMWCSKIRETLQISGAWDADTAP